MFYGGDPATALEQGLKRLLLLRLVMVTTLLAIAIYVQAVSEHLLPIDPLYFFIAATYTLTVLHALALRFVEHREVLAYLQVLADLFVVTGLIWVAGGVRAGFMLLYPICVLSGAVLLYRRDALVLSGLATFLYASLLYAVHNRLLPPQGLPDVPYLAPRTLIYSIFVMGVSCCTVALIGSYLAENLRRVGARLEAATEQVADLQELNQVIVDSIHSGLATADGGGRVLYLNAFGARILGVRPSEAQGHPLAMVFRSRLLESSLLQARADQGLERFEFGYQPAEGNARSLGVSVSPLATATGGYLLVFQDLTEIKRLEEEVRLKEKLAAVGEMAAQLAHEIRNPLGSISGSAQVLMSDAGLGDEQQRLLGIIRRESKRLSDALNQFLFQVRPPRPFQPVDLAPLVEEAVTLLRNGPEVGPHHQVVYEQAGAPHVCRADPDRIAQVVWNLVRNGLEAMPDGGCLRVRLDRGVDEALLSVRDEGRGIGDDARSLFTPFQSGRPLGTGLGLAIVYRIVREHSGDITIRSVAPRGTEVRVHLPLLGHSAPATV